MGTRKIFRRGAILSLIAAGVLVASGLAGMGAAADPVPNGASAYEIDVPSSVLAAASVGGGSAVGGDLTDADVGALLANTTPFDSRWKAFFDEYGPELSDLSTSDAATIAAMEAQFAAPATVFGTIAKTAGTAAVVVSAVQAGFALGPYFDSAVGIDDDPGLCAGGQADAIGSIIATLTSVNCPEWKVTQAFIAQANQDAAPVVSGGKTCSLSVPTDCATLVSGIPDSSGACFNLEGPGTIWIWRGANSTITYHDPTGGGSGLVAGTGDGCLISGSGDFDLGTFTGAPIASYCVGAQNGNFEDNCGLDSPEQVTRTPGNPQRHFTCTVTMTDGSTVSQNSSGFFESGTTIPRPEAPGIPVGKTPQSTTCSEIGGTSPSVVVPPTPTTGAYQDWSENHPNCVNGSCSLELEKDGSSCFTDDVDCDGWVTDANRDDNYECLYGGDSVALSECFIYGTTFNANDRENGHTYADPSTGEITEAQTSPSDVDVVTSALVSREDDWVATGSYPVVDATSRLTIARQVATACVAQVDHQNDITIIKVSPKEICAKVPIYSPGIDVLQAAQHDAEAISNNQPFLLHFENESQKSAGSETVDPVLRGWYGDAATNCQGPVVARPDPTYTNCDEYPFYSTVEGGPGASLKNISGTDNGTQGNQLQQFYSACGITPSSAPSEANEYIVAPNPVSPTVAVCGDD